MIHSNFTNEFYTLELIYLKENLSLNILFGREIICKVIVKQITICQINNLLKISLATILNIKSKSLSLFAYFTLWKIVLKYELAIWKKGNYYHTILNVRYFLRTVKRDTYRIKKNIYIINIILYSQ